MEEDRTDAEVVSAALVEPIEGAAVGGDFQLLEDVGSRTVAIVGDITGNGEDAAPYAERACELFGDHLREAADPAVLLERVNSAVHHDAGFDRFLTACVVVIDRSSWAAEWGFAGHLPPHWLDTGLPIDGATPGWPLGFESRCGALSAQRRPLSQREGMLLFTDGLEDVRSAAGDRFGSARITHVLARELRDAPPDQVVRRLKQVACEFGSNRLGDDLCLLAVRIT